MIHHEETEVWAIVLFVALCLAMIGCLFSLIPAAETLDKIMPLSGILAPMI